MSRVLADLSGIAILGMSLDRIVLSFLLILAGLIVRRLISDLVLRRLVSLTRHTKTVLDDLLIDAVRKPLEAGIVLVFLAIAVTVLQVPKEPVDVRKIVHALVALSTTVVATWLLFRLVDALATHLRARASQTESRIDDALVPLVSKAIKIFLAVLAFVVTVQNLGYSVAGLLAGLGIGGLALALAAQDTIANLLGSIMILLDRPFRVGDWIRGTGFEGTIEEIGFRSTRVRTFPKTLVSVPNKQMADMIIDNQQAMPVRRILMTIGVTYSSTPVLIREAVNGIRAIIDALPGIWSDGTLVRFSEFGASSLNIVVRCYTLATAYDEHMRVREDLHLRIMELFEKLGLDFAFPSQTIYYGGGQRLSVGLGESLPAPFSESIDSLDATQVEGLGRERASAPRASASPASASPPAQDDSSSTAGNA